MGERRDSILHTDARPGSRPARPGCLQSMCRLTGIVAATLFVMARLVRATYASTPAATGGPDKPGHDGVAVPVVFSVSLKTLYAAVFTSRRRRCRMNSV